MPWGENASTTTSAQRTRSSITSWLSGLDEIERQAPLVAVEVVEQARLLGVALVADERRQRASRVDPVRRLHPDHLGAVVGQHPAGRRARPSPTSGRAPSGRRSAGPVGAGPRPASPTPTAGRRAAGSRRPPRCARRASAGGAAARAAWPRTSRAAPGNVTGPYLAHVDRLPVVAGRELRAGEHVGRRRDRGDQHPALHRASSRSSALVLEAKKSTRTRSRIRSYSASGLPTVEQHHRVLDPVLVTGRLVAEPLLVDPFHEPPGEGADGRAEQERDRHVAVGARPHQLDVDAAVDDAAGHPLGERGVRAATVSICEAAIWFAACWTDTSACWPRPERLSRS